jgi:carbon dioxide concentrating mechanism protein CcmN
MVQAHEQLAIGDYYIGANVELAPDVAIAAGVVLEAAPGARLVIASGVCLGLGVIVQAAGGKLVLGAGVNLGSGVLIVGQGLVGPHACIGAESSLFNPQITAGAVLPARSLHGMPGAGPDSSVASNGQVTSSAHPSDEHDTGSDPSTAGAVEPEAIANGAAETPPEEGGLAPNRTVYGREQVTQLMKTLFPHRDALNGNGQSPS